MFVRLFVDENLDRHVPISKQPKEKIQAIIDSCTRQFPEYSERSRKRIRTYLKSCRRTKRSREQAGLDINNVSIQPVNMLARSATRVEHSWSEIMMLLRQLVLYGTRAPIIGPFRAWKPSIPYAIKNHRGASKIPPSRGLWMRRAGSL